MKKRIILVLTVLMLAAPAWSEVLITGTAVGNNVTVHYDARSEPNLVRGFGLDVQLNEVSGATITGFTVDSFFDIYYPIYPGSIDINDSTGQVDANGSPICDPCVYPGTLPGLNSSGMTVEFGSLYEKGVDTPPDPCGDMFTITVSGDCVVCITENTVRGGVVMETAGSDPDVNAPCITVGSGGCVVPDVVGDPNLTAQAAIVAAGFTVGTITEDCNDSIAAGNVISTNPAAGATPGCGTAVAMVVSTGACECYAGMADYLQWQTVGEPNCWCYPRQCHGDVDGYEVPAGKIDPAHWVGVPDLQVLSEAWKKEVDDVNGVLSTGGIYLACADIDHAEVPAGKIDPAHRVGVPDLQILSYFWKETHVPEPNCLPGNCTPGNPCP
jgi:hypothetical protein